MAAVSIPAYNPASQGPATITGGHDTSLAQDDLQKQIDQQEQTGFQKYMSNPKNVQAVAATYLQRQQALYNFYKNKVASLNSTPGTQYTPDSVAPTKAADIAIAQKAMDSIQQQMKQLDSTGYDTAANPKFAAWAQGHYTRQVAAKIPAIAKLLAAKNNEQALGRPGSGEALWNQQQQSAYGNEVANAVGQQMAPAAAAAAAKVAATNATVKLDGVKGAVAQKLANNTIAHDTSMDGTAAGNAASLAAYRKAQAEGIKGRLKLGTQQLLEKAGVDKSNAPLIAAHIAQLHAAAARDLSDTYSAPPVQPATPAPAATGTPPGASPTSGTAVRDLNRGNTAPAAPTAPAASAATAMVAPAMYLAPPAIAARHLSQAGNSAQGAAQSLMQNGFTHDSVGIPLANYLNQPTLPQGVEGV